MKTYSAKLFLAAALALGATACDSVDPKGNAAQYDYRQKHPLVVEPRIAAMQLGPTDDHGRLAGFAAEFLRRGSGQVEISVGAVDAEDGQARATGQAIAAALLDAGLKPSELRLQLVLDEPSIAPGAAFLRFNTATVRMPDCYDWSDGPLNAPSANFGCAMQHNLGAMVVDPRDLLQQHSTEPPTAERASDVTDKFNQGKDTWTSPLPLKADTKSSGGQ